MREGPALRCLTDIAFLMYSDGQPQKGITAMPLSMYQASVPLFTQTLSGMSNVLDKGAAHYADKEWDIAGLVSMRLAPDMMTLAEQVQMACHHSVVAVSRFADIDQPDLGATDSDISSMKARIAASLAFMAGVKPEQMEGSETRRAEIQIRVGPVAFAGQDLLLHFAIPQVLFHATTAYDIVRHAGAGLAKIDFLGDAFSRKIA